MLNRYNDYVAALASSAGRVTKAGLWLLYTLVVYSIIIFYQSYFQSLYLQWYLTMFLLLVPGQCPVSLLSLVPGQCPVSLLSLVPSQCPVSLLSLVPGQCPVCLLSLVPSQCPVSLLSLVPSQCPVSLLSGSRSLYRIVMFLLITLLILVPGRCSEL